MKNKFYFQRSCFGYCLVPAFHVYVARYSNELDIYVAFWNWTAGVAISKNRKPAEYDKGFAYRALGVINKNMRNLLG